MNVFLSYYRSEVKAAKLFLFKISLERTSCFIARAISCILRVHVNEFNFKHNGFQVNCILTRVTSVTKQHFISEGSYYA